MEGVNQGSSHCFMRVRVFSAYSRSLRGRRRVPEAGEGGGGGSRFAAVHGGAEGVAAGGGEEGAHEDGAVERRVQVGGEEATEAAE